MGTGNSWKSDLPGLWDYDQISFQAYPKQLFIETLREFFSSDSYYHYQRDEFGFNKTPDQTNMPQEAGLYDDVTTRLFIGEPYRRDIIFYPAILIRAGGFRSVPISMSRDKRVIQWKNLLFQDGYGNEKIIKVPEYEVRDGAWEGTITVEIKTRSPFSRDELTHLVSILFVDTKADEMQYAGVFVKPNGINPGSPSEEDDRTDKLFKQTISFEVRTEWIRKIPLFNFIETINFCFDIGNFKTNIFSPNLEIKEQFTLSDII